MTTRATRWLLGLAPIVLALAFTWLLIVVVGSDPVAVFEKLWEGAFRNSNALAGTFNFWIPLTLASMGLIITFTAGLWNIGVEGQIMMGAVFASWGARTLVLPTPILVPVELALAMLGGALWGAVVGFLKTRLGVHEIFGGVALNALANVFTIYLISGPWQPPEGGSAQATPPFADYALMPPISGEFPVSLVALVLTALAVIGVFLALRGTRWGLQLKATGKNARSALLLGVPTTRSTMTAFMACGAIAGIAGAYRVLFTYASLRPLASGNIGFLALLVVLLVSMRPLWAPLVAFAFAALFVGSTRLKVALQLDQSLADVLQGIVVLCVVLFDGVRERLRERQQARRPGELPAPQPPTPARMEGAAHE